MTSETANTVAEQRVADAEAVLTQLRGRRAAVAERAEAARQSRVEVAYDAARGSSEAARTLATARKASLESTYELEDTDSAIATAEARLREAQAALEAERREGERLEIVRLCRQRLEVAEQVNASWSAVVSDIVELLKLGGELEVLKRGRWKDELDGQDFIGTTSRAALLRSCPRDLLSLLGLDSPFLAASHGSLALNDGARTVADWLSTDEELEAGDGPDGGDAGPPDGPPDGEPVLPPEDDADDDELAARAA